MTERLIDRLIIFLDDGQTYGSVKGCEIHTDYIVNTDETIDFDFIDEDRDQGCFVCLEDLVQHGIDTGFIHAIGDAPDERFVVSGEPTALSKCRDFKRFLETDFDIKGYGETDVITYLRWFTENLERKAQREADFDADKGGLGIAA